MPSRTRVALFGRRAGDAGRTPQDPQLVMLVGDPSLGRGAPLASAVTAASCQVVAIRGRRSGAGRPLGAFRQAVEQLSAYTAVLPDRLRGVTADASATGDPDALRATLTGLLVAAGRTKPLVFAAYDVQDYDRASRELLAAALGRLAHEPVSVLLAAGLPTLPGAGAHDAPGGTGAGAGATLRPLTPASAAGLLTPPGFGAPAGAAGPPSARRPVSGRRIHSMPSCW